MYDPKNWFSIISGTTAMLDVIAGECAAHYEDAALSQDWSHELELKKSADELAELIRKTLQELSTDLADGWTKDVERATRLELERTENRHRELYQSFKNSFEKAGHRFPLSEREFLRQMRASLPTHLSTPETGETAYSAIYEKLAIEEAYAALASIEDRCNRSIALYNLIREVPIAELRDETLKYMRLLSRCFLSGFDIETIALCRAVLDAAFRDSMNDGQNLMDRVEQSIRVGIITADEGKIARAVISRGNDAIHASQKASVDVEDTVRKTLSLLRKLFGNDAK